MSDAAVKKNFDLYPGLEQPKIKESKTDYSRGYSITSYILLFFTFSIVGWIWEVVLHLIDFGSFANRGVLLGPWLPIYGTGGVIALLLLHKIFNNPLLTFFSVMALSGTVEYVTSWYLELTKGVKWWDYSGYVFNINGRICAEGLIAFGLGGCACIYLLAPRLDELFKKIPRNIKISVCSVLVACFVADMIYSHFHPNMGSGITDISADLIRGTVDKIGSLFV